MTVRATITEPAAVGTATRHGAEGAGLVCLESAVRATGTPIRALLAERGPAGYARLLSDALLPVCEAFPALPIWVRTLDFDGMGGDGEPEAPRGIQADLEWPEHHAAQWMAVRTVHDAGFTNVGVLLSRVYQAEQLRAAQWMRDSAALGESCALGILVQSAAPALCIEDFLDAGVDAVAFDTGELARTTLGLDVGLAGDPAHPAVMRLMGGVAAVCLQAGVEMSACGPGAADPDLVRRYVSLGIHVMSCEPDVIPVIRQAVGNDSTFSQFRAWPHATDPNP